MAAKPCFRVCLGEKSGKRTFCSLFKEFLEGTDVL